MYKILILFIIFFKIGMFSFGGGYATLPFIQQEFIHKYNWLTSNEFLDLLALSQSTPGPIAINSATFVGSKVGGILGSIFATLGVVLFSLIGLTLISRVLDKFKDNPYVIRLLKVLRPLTLGFILSAGYLAFKDVSWDLYSSLVLIISFILLYTKKLNPILVIFVFGLLGIFITNI